MVPRHPPILVDRQAFPAKPGCLFKLATIPGKLREAADCIGKKVLILQVPKGLDTLFIVIAGTFQVVEMKNNIAQEGQGTDIFLIMKAKFLEQIPGFS